ncbi:sodium channel protein para-like isoform X1 [Mytilus edulis]|uniref:sodium channel protein para-like isoform X1 n=1 Tax=Mytilus edulis TaxID=6550 RepID=UPI0039EEF819
MDMLEEEEDTAPFVLFTPESLATIHANINDLKAIKKADKQAAEEGEEEELPHHEEEPKPDPKFEVGKKLPRELIDDFPPEFVGKPIEDLDEYYDPHMTFCVIGKDKSIYRFSATNALFLLSPFNPFRRIALYLLVHPLFNALVIITIIVNCVFMAMPEDKKYGDYIEYVFTGIYTIEAVVKITARGFILKPFTYLRDLWNWLDFTVISLAYVTMLLPKDLIGNLAAIRTFRVLRALKTVAVVPGLKTIVGALLEAVRRLRDVIILSIFMLSIFALIGMQLYMGALRHKCVKLALNESGAQNTNMSNTEWFDWVMDEEHWEVKAGDEFTMCGNDTGAGKCKDGYRCMNGTHSNPNYNYTHYDNFGVSLLLSFRLMTQDYWENLYQLILRAQGPWYCLYFMIVIFLGSFYLVNLILAIVAMSYDETQKQDQADAEEEEEGKRKYQASQIQKKIDQLEQERHEHDKRELIEMLTKEPSDITGSLHDINDDESIKSEKPTAVENHLSVTKPCSSLPSSPFSRRSSWRMKYAKHLPPSHPDHQPLVPPFLDIRNNLPYADDSNAVTPNSDDLCTLPINKQFLTARRSSFASIGRRSHGGDPRASSRRSSYASLISRASRASIRSREHPRSPKDKTAKLLERWAKKHPHLLPEDSTAGSEYDGEKKKADHNTVCRTSSGRTVDVQDVMVLKELLEHASSHRPSIFSDGSFEEEKMIKKLQRIFCSWTCCPQYLTFQKIVALFILDAFIDLFITICILVNTGFMAADHYGMSQELREFLEAGNYVFTGIFAAEAFLKIIALNPMEYLKDRWNCFDIVIVILSFVELALEGVKGLSVLRSFRLLRVFKLAKSWPTLNMLISVVARTMGALGNLVFVLGIVIFIFAVMGQQLFGQSYERYGNPNETIASLRDSERPRWHFMDFLHSFMIVFRVLCGEWIESMWGCQRVSGWPCIPFFLLTFTIGNLVVLNLFLALLLSSFSNDNVEPSTAEPEPNKLAEAISRFERFFRWIKVKTIVIAKSIKGRLVTKPKPPALPPSSPEVSRFDMNGKDSMVDGHQVIGINGSIDPQNFDDHPKLTIQDTVTVEIINGGTPDTIEGDNASTKSASRASSIKSRHSDDSKSLSSSSTSDDEDSKKSVKKVDATGEPEINDVEAVFANQPDECFCSIFRRNCACCIRCEHTTIGKKWWSLRCKAFAMVEHKYFETFIITMILASSLALALEDVYLRERPVLKEVLNYFDKFFTVIFILEMLLKWVAFGYKKYFTDAWCWLDFVIVSISIIMLVIENLPQEPGQKGDGVGSLKALRTLRALRPLRAVSRWEGMRVVVNALIKAIPSIANVLLVCLVFWLIFGIVGVQFFNGKFHRCVDANDIRLPQNIVAHYNDCIRNMNETGYKWVNPDVNFDTVYNAYLALFQVATYKGWTLIMDDAIDTPTEIGYQPGTEINVYMYLYFVLFIIFGSFFTLNLFIGVIIENFNQQKKKAGGSLEMFMTEDQKKYYKAMKRMASKSPQKSIPRPDFWPLGKMYDLVTNQAFDIGIMIVIMLNMLTMTLEHHNMTETFSTVLIYINMSFIVVFTVECVLKLLALRWFYFKIPWNVFDFVVVVLSILGVAIKDAMEALLVPPTLLRVVRVFRVGRVLRLVKSAKGIRTLLFSLAVSLPALFNIGLLLFLVMFIYATFGMSFFMNVKHTHGLDDTFNFETFGRSIIMLFQMCTSAGWSDTLAGLINENVGNKTDDCNPNADPPNCGSYGIAVAYLVSYLIISFLVVVNMYIAVILENFSQATEDVQHGLTPDDFDMYYEKWEHYDPNATQFIDLDKLSDFVDYLEEPLRLPKPNHFLLVKLDIPICDDDKMYCRDILDALTKNFLGSENLDNTDMGVNPLQQDKAKVEYNVVSSTMKRQVMNYAARVIQRRWRKYQHVRGDLPPPPPSYNEATQNVSQEEQKDEQAENDIEIVISPSENRTVELGPDSDVVA